MKTFLSVLAAILAAVAILAGAFIAYDSTLGAWQRRKASIVRQLNAQHFVMLERLRLAQGGSLDQMTYALVRAKDDEAAERQIQVALKKVLEEKPILGLTDEESKLLAEATDASNKQPRK